MIITLRHEQIDLAYFGFVDACVCACCGHHRRTFDAVLLQQLRVGGISAIVDGKCETHHYSAPRAAHQHDSALKFLAANADYANDHHCSMWYAHISVENESCNFVKLNQLPALEPSLAFGTIFHCTTFVYSNYRAASALPFSRNLNSLFSVFLI